MSDTATQTFVVGQKVRVYRDDIVGMAANRVGTIREIDGDEFLWVDGATENDYGYARRIGDETTRGSWFNPSELTPVDEPAEDDNRTPLQAKVDRLIADLQTIGKALAETADRSEWCSEYEAHLNRLVPKLSEYGRYAFEQAATREHEYVVTYTVQVRASGPDEAQTKAEAEVNNPNNHGAWYAAPYVREYRP